MKTLRNNTNEENEQDYAIVRETFAHGEPGKRRADRVEVDALAWLARRLRIQPYTISFSNCTKLK